MSEVDTTDWRLAVAEKSLQEYKDKFQKQCELNRVFINQNALLIERNTALEKQIARLLSGVGSVPWKS